MSMLSRFRRTLKVPFLCRNYAYTQGQSPEPRIREYFYYVDHQGLLYMDDSRMKNFTTCFKEVRFLTYFFKRLKINDTGRYMEEFPYLSLCGRERNFVRCDDLPVVFTEMMGTENKDRDEYSLCYAHTDGVLTVPFEPEKLCMSLETGRVYHPAPDRVGGAGLVRSKFALELSKLFVFKNGENEGPTHINWQRELIKLEDSWKQNTVLAEKHRVTDVSN